MNDEGVPLDLPEQQPKADLHGRLDAAAARESISVGRRSREAHGEYVAALHRLIDGRPKSDELIGLQEEFGRVPITQDTVSIEAGRKRGRISGPKSDFPQLAAFIKSLRETHAVSSTTTAKIAWQAQKIARLEQSLTATRSAAAVQVIRIEKLAAALRQSRQNVARLEQAIERAGGGSPRLSPAELRLADRK